jgi:hypothetical protein
VLASAPAWAVRPSAASARAAEAQASSCQLGHKLDAILFWQARSRPSPSSIVGSILRKSLQRIACSPWPPGQSAQFQLGLTQNAKCLKSPHASVVPQGLQFSRFRPSRFRVPVIPSLSRVRLTAPSRGRPASGPPLTSNVRHHASIELWRPPWQHPADRTTRLGRR